MSNTYYPFSYVYKNKRIILIWQTNDQTGDRFLINDGRQLIFSDSEKELRKLLGTTAGEVCWEDRTEINLDKFLDSLNRLKTHQVSSIKTCELLLNGWNFIEDLLKTFNLNQELERLKSPVLNKAYKKLFYGCNFPSITPKNQSYSPLWTNEEILLVRREIKFIWFFLMRNNYVPF